MHIREFCRDTCSYSNEDENLRRELAVMLREARLRTCVRLEYDLDCIIPYTYFETIESWLSDITEESSCDYVNRWADDAKRYSDSCQFASRTLEKTSIEWSAMEHWLQNAGARQNAEEEDTSKPVWSTWFFHSRQPLSPPIMTLSQQLGDVVHFINKLRQTIEQLGRIWENLNSDIGAMSFASGVSGLIRTCRIDRDRAVDLVRFALPAISSTETVCALVALVNDIKPSLRKVVDIYKSSSRSRVDSLQISNLIYKMSDKVGFTVRVINLCATEDKDVWDRWLPGSALKLKWDSARKKRAVMRKIHLALGNGMLVALITVDAKWWEYVGSVGILFYAILVLTEHCEDARDRQAEIQIFVAKNMQKVRKNAVRKSVTAALALATELKAKDDGDSWGPGREEYFQALMQEVGNMLGRISVSDLIPGQIDALESCSSNGT
ncbi:hypothetical protein FS837_012889 [Tulasnella sp. UAMH 9824]|nr:hypothetical protein FS837_012889 [Tulasnella sp. UAMH 9824]